MKDRAGKIKHHYGFYGSMHCIYDPGHPGLVFHQEYQLGEEPPWMDMLVLNPERKTVLTDPIGQFFRTYNVLEYKSARDALNIDAFFKPLGYALFYKSMGKTVNEVPLEELTVSLFRHTYPRELFAELRRSGFGWEVPHPGVYRITGPLCVPMQVIVISRLPRGEYGALKILAKNAAEEDVLKFLRDAEESGVNADYMSHVSAVLRVSVAMNKELYNRMGGEEMTVKMLEEVFPELLAEKSAKDRAEGIAIGEERGRLEGEARGEAQGKLKGILATLSALVQDGILTLKEAALRAGMSEKKFLAQVQALQ